MERKPLFDFFHLGKIDLNPQMAFEMLHLAEQYMLDKLKYKCEKIILEGVDEENVSSILVDADKYNAKNLVKSCVEFIVKHTDVMEKDNFKQLPQHLLLVIMGKLAGK